MLRKTFLEHFGASNHKIIPSTSVVPHKDATLAFVNAGMNQFKDVFLGNTATNLKRAANIQKCIRLNDIGLVGLDSHHHTFFEMMGSWSFGDYYKLEACELAWDLLTGTFNLPKDRLLITYYGGCEELGIEADLETKNIWLSLGVPEARIKHTEDNFWEMGLTGPCGPCTEIHYMAGDGTLLEIWNIVFMELSRKGDGTCDKLPVNHVDTGMGLERLAAILSGSNSNYDSALFRPIFRRLETLSGKPEYAGKFLGAGHIDTGYRVLADHSRMISVAVADKAFPDTSPRLRHVMRRAFRASKTYFECCSPDFVIEVCREVSDLLGEQYPEIPSEMHLIAETIKAEHENFLGVERQGLKLFPQFIQQFPSALSVDIFDVPMYNDALKYLSKVKDSSHELSSVHAVKLYDTYGLSIENVREVFDILGLTFHESIFLKEISAMKKKSKTYFDAGSTLLDGIESTDDSFKYQYTSSSSHKYEFKAVKANVVGLLNSEGKRVDSLTEGEQSCCVYLDKTCFYAEQGGQVGDTGTVTGKNAKFHVTDCQRISNDRVAHVGDVVGGEISVGMPVQLHINKQRRIACMQNHTGTHLLNASLHSLFPHVHQRSSHVGEDCLKFDAHLLNASVTSETVDELESNVNKVIARNEKVKRRTVSAKKMREMSKLVTIPGENYPANVRIVELPDSSKEPCCGTHVLNTGDVRAFTIVKVKTTRTGVASFTCLTGEAAIKARDKGLHLIDFVTGTVAEVERLNEQDSNEVTKLHAKLDKTLREVNNAPAIPHNVQTEMANILNELCDHLVSLKRRGAKLSLLEELEAALKASARTPGSSAEMPFVHVFRDCDVKVDLTKLQKKCGRTRAVFLLAAGNSQVGGVRAKAFVPRALVTEGVFDAKKWMSMAVGGAFGGKADVKAPRGQNPEQVCNMNHLKEYVANEEELNEIVQRAEDFALKHIQ